MATDSSANDQSIDERSATQPQPAADPGAELWGAIWRRYADSPGVIPLAVTSAVTAQVSRASEDRLPLFTELVQRWSLPVAGSVWNWSELPYAPLIPWAESGALPVAGVPLASAPQDGGSEQASPIPTATTVGVQRAWNGGGSQPDAPIALAPAGWTAAAGDSTEIPLALPVAPPSLQSEQVEHGHGQAQPDPLHASTSAVATRDVPQALPVALPSLQRQYTEDIGHFGSPPSVQAPDALPVQRMPAGDVGGERPHRRIRVGPPIVVQAHSVDGAASTSVLARDSTAPDTLPLGLQQMGQKLGAAQAELPARIQAHRVGSPVEVASAPPLLQAEPAFLPEGNPSDAIHTLAVAPWSVPAASAMAQEAPIAAAGDGALEQPLMVARPVAQAEIANGSPAGALTVARAVTAPGIWRTTDQRHPTVPAAILAARSLPNPQRSGGDDPALQLASGEIVMPPAPATPPLGIPSGVASPLPPVGSIPLATEVVQPQADSVPQATEVVRLQAASVPLAIELIQRQGASVPLAAEVIRPESGASMAVPLAAEDWRFAPPGMVSALPAPHPAHNGQPPELTLAATPAGEVARFVQRAPATPLAGAGETVGGIESSPSGGAPVASVTAPAPANQEAQTELLVERVVRRLSRELAVERERQGWQPWNSKS